jgi:hypothetical protein
MRFSKSVDRRSLPFQPFIRALEDAVYGRFRRMPVPYVQSDTLATSILQEVYEILDGARPLIGAKGVLHAFLMIASSETERSLLLRGDQFTKFVLDWESFDHSQIDFLLELVEIVDRRLVYLGLPQDDTLNALTDIVSAVCCVLDGGDMAENQRWTFLPILGFAKDSSGAEVTTSGRASWMQQYVHGVVGKYFANHFT